MSLRTIKKAQLDESYVFPSTRMGETIRDHTRPQDAKKRTRTRWGFVLYALIGVGDFDLKNGRIYDMLI